MRLLAAGLPLILIALVFGVVGYVTATPGQTGIAPLPLAPTTAPSLVGEVASVTDDRISLALDTGETMEYGFAAGVTVEKLEPIDLSAIQLGDWLNGGAIPHPQTILALVDLILLPEPVTP